jgi:hypothetical protein
MDRSRLLKHLPSEVHANARWVYLCLEEHFLDHAVCQKCARQDNTLRIRGDAIAHIKTIVGDFTNGMDMNGIILQLRKSLIQYLATEDVTVITFTHLAQQQKESVA